jgi:chromosome segregation protein
MQTQMETMGAEEESENEQSLLDSIQVENEERYDYRQFLKKFAVGTQFLVITHRKGTMEAADTVYGVTMEEKGISKLLSMKLNKQ